MKYCSNKDIISLLSKALIRNGYRMGEFTVTLSPSRLIADVKTPKIAFSVMLSERKESHIRKHCGFALSEDSVSTITNLNIRYIFFHSPNANVGFLIEARHGKNPMIYEYKDEFNSRVWVYYPSSIIVNSYERS